MTQTLTDPTSHLLSKAWLVLWVFIDHNFDWSFEPFNIKSLTGPSSHLLLKAWLVLSAFNDLKVWLILPASFELQHLNFNPNFQFKFRFYKSLTIAADFNHIQTFPTRKFFPSFLCPHHKPLFLRIFYDNFIKNCLFSLLI